MRSRPTRSSRWAARTLILTLLFGIVVVGDTSTYAAASGGSRGPLGSVAASPGPAPRTADWFTAPALRDVENYSCAVSHRRQGAEVWVSVRNTAPTTVTGWTLTWALPDTAPIWAVWNAALVSHTGGIVTTRDLGWNANLAPGVEVTVGYLANGIVPPSDFALNGESCQVG